MISKQRIPQLLCFFLSLFICLMLLTGLITALYTIFVVLLLNALVEKYIWIRFPEILDTILEKLIFGSMLGLGFLSLIWTFFALFLTGRSRALFLILFLLILVVFPIKKKPIRPFTNAPSFHFWHFIPLVLILLTLVYFPFNNLGKETPSGFAYRAYAADILKHFSITNAITNHKVPPENPYFKGATLHYYWMPYALPSLIMTVNGDTQKAVLAFSITIDFLLLGAIFVLIFSTFKNKNIISAYFLTLAPILFLSFEGFYLLFFKLHFFKLQNFLPLTTGYNIDGLTRWWWNTPQIDTLLRTVIYTPQAASSLGFFICYLHLRKKTDSPLFLSPLLLIFSLFSNLLVGSAFAIYYGCHFLYQAIMTWKKRLPLKPIRRQFFLTILFLAAAFVILIVLGVIIQSGNKFVFQPLSFTALQPFLFLNLGMLLVIGLTAGLLAAKKEPYLIASLVILIIISTIRIQGFTSDISLKLSLPLAVILTLATAEWLQKLPGKIRKWTALSFFVLCLPGIFSSAIDIYNSADITNRQFTVYLPRAEMLMMRWARKALPQDSVVQDYPAARQGDSSNIPTFMARQTYAGDVINGRLFFIADDAYYRRMEDLKTILADLPARQSDLKKAGMDYLFWGENEQKAFHYIPKMKVAKRIQNIYLFEIK
jgi:hypothetical protein